MGSRPRTGENRICIVCGNEYYVSGWRLKRGPSKFCGTECQNHKQYERFKFNCKQCGKECESSPCRKGKKSFCSIGCCNEFQIDRKNCNREKRRKSIAEARSKGIVGNTGPAIRKYVLKNKKPECEVCGYMEYECCLDIHHKDKDPNNNSLENLKVLCVMCHRKVHRKIIKL